MKYKQNQKNIEVDIKDIHPNIKNPRKGQYDGKDLDELKENMESMGQLSAIKIDENGTLLAGHRRYVAAKELGWTKLRCDIITGLTEFSKSAIMISDNATQRQFNAWESRQAISDIYWNEFCEEYEFRNSSDKGYTEFAKKIGVSKSTVTKVLSSMSKDNKAMILRLKSAGCGTEVLDTILATPQKYREELANKAIALTKNKKSTGLREYLRMHKKTLMVKEMKKNLHPNFFAAIHYKLNAIGAVLTKDIIMAADINERIKLKKDIQKNILPGLKLLIDNSIIQGEQDEKDNP